MCLGTQTAERPSKLTALMLLAPSRNGVFTDETVSVRLLFLHQSQIFHNQSLIMSDFYHLQSPALPLGQVPPFHFNAHSPEHSAQGVSGALSLVLVWSLVPRSTPWLGGHLSAVMTKALCHHVTGTRWTPAHQEPKLHRAHCPAKPILNLANICSHAGKARTTVGVFLALGMKDPLDNLYFIYMMSIRL